MRTPTLSLLFLLMVVSFNFARGAHENATDDISKLDVTQGGVGIPGNSEVLRLLQKLLKLFQSPDIVSFDLYTQLNPKDAQHLHIDDIESVLSSNFNVSHPTRITIHGWMSGAEQDVNTMIRDAYLSRGPHNIIVFNWIAESVNIYDSSIKNVPRIGRKLGNFLDFMVENGMIKPEKLTIIGHSLGSHIAGIAARSLKKGQVHTIIGLDPAQPGFSYETSKHRLRSSDAYYVESIQTTAMSLGYIEPIGKAAFYPNGGVFQPNCGMDMIKSCGHFRAYVYLAEAIRYGGFPSIKCNSYADAINMNCGNKFSQSVRMGDPRNADIASGAYYVPVFPNPPYSYSS